MELVLAPLKAQEPQNQIQPWAALRADTKELMVEYTGRREPICHEISAHQSQLLGLLFLGQFWPQDYPGGREIAGGDSHLPGLLSCVGVEGWVS